MDRGKWFCGSILLSFGVKAGSVVTGFLTARAVWGWFDDQTVQGIWYTLTSALLLLLNFDLGLGNGLRQQLTGAFAREDWKTAEKYVSTGLAAYGGMTAALALAGAVVFPLLDWEDLLGGAVSPRVLAVSAAFVFLGILLRFFLLSVAAVLNALQMTAVNNVLALSAGILQLLFLSCGNPRDAEQGLIWLSAGYALLVNFPAAAAGIFLWFSGKDRCRPAWQKADLTCLKPLLGVGTSFFVCQIAYMVLLNTNEMLISANFGPQYTTEYTYYYKLATLSAMVAAPILVPVWSAVAGAMAKGERQWVCSLYRRLKWTGLAAALGQFAFVAIQQSVMTIWLGNFRIEYETAWIFAFFGAAFTYGMILSTLVSGMGQLKLQMLCYGIGAGGKLLWVPYMCHWRQVVLCNALVLGVYCILQQWVLDRNFRSGEAGNLG